MASLADAFVRLRPDSSGFKSEAEKGINSAGLGKMGEAHGKAFGTSFSGAFRGVVAGLGAVFAGVGLVEFLKDSIAEQREAIRVGNITNAVIKSTGGAAHITAGQVSDLATAMSLKTGVDDEAIQSGENLLLTFTRIRNEAGKGNDIFNQASAAIEDMTAAMNNGTVTTEGLKASTIQVGKALNDPIKGITALTRVGVTFSDQQKEQIKNFVASGNIMGAQKVILAELAKEFGGAAAAAADPAQKMAVAWKNFQEQVGGFVLPILASLGAFLGGTILPLIQNQIIPRIQDMAGWFKLGFTDGQTGASGLAGILGGLGHIVATVWDQVKAFWTGMTTGAGGSASTMQQLGAIIKNDVIPAIGTLVGWLSQAIGWLTSGDTWAGLFRTVLLGVAVAIGAITVATKVWTAAQTALDVALNANPISLIVIAIAALVAGIIYAYTHFKTFRDIVDNTWRVIAASALWAWNNVLKPTGEALVAAWGVIATSALWLWHNVLDPVFKGIAAVVSWAWNNVIYPAFQAINAVIVNVIAPVISWLWHNVVTPAMQAISIAFQIAAAIIRPILETIGWVITNVLAPVISWLWHNVVQPVFKGIGDTIGFVWNNVIRPVFDAFGNVINNNVAPAFRAGVQAIKAAWDGVKEVAKVPINFVIGFINAGIIHPYNAIAGAFGVKDRVQDIQKLATGGMFRGVGGPRDDANLALLSDQEFVVNAASTAKWLPVLEYINSEGRRGHGPTARYPGDGSHGIKAFADGGFVGWLSSIGKGIWDAITDPAKFIGDLANKLLAGIPGGEPIVHLLEGAGHKLISGLINWVKGSGGSAAASTVGWLHSQATKPYRWNTAGPGTYDCSGLVSAVWNLLHGRNPYQHTFSTGNEEFYFPLHGMGGVLSAGWSNPYESGPGGGATGVGHTAGVLAGIPFEARGGDGVVVGGGVTPIGAFAHVGHFDQGGQLAPGWNLAYNGTGRGEPVGGPLELSDATIAKLGRAIGREINGVGSSVIRTARAH